MKKSTILIVMSGVCICLMGLIIFLIVDKKQLQPARCTMEAQLCPDGSAVGRGGPSCAFAPCPDVAADVLNKTPMDVSIIEDRIRVTAPLPESVVKSPLTIRGEARGTWYFEASFPISIIDEAGAVIGQGVAQAKGEWMTTEFVPFEATIDFTTPPTGTGSIVLSRDNPSGLPENDAQIIIPIKF